MTWQILGIVVVFVLLVLYGNVACRRAARVYEKHRRKRSKHGKNGPHHT